MKNLPALTLSFGLLVCGLAYAAESKDGTTAQQEKRTACNAQAGDKKADDRKAFAKRCLWGKQAGASESCGDVATKQDEALQPAGHRQERYGAQGIHESLFIEKSLTR